MLGKILQSLKETRAAYDFEQRDKWIQRGREIDDHVFASLLKFGDGSIDLAVSLMCQHPFFKRRDDEREGLNLELSAIERIEKRWLEAWREVMR